jgi:ABC-type uncharacterized transport system substrate-binding protein
VPRARARTLRNWLPDLILTNGAVVGPLLEVTRSVPVVFVLVADPVGAGFVDSLAGPVGNATASLRSNTASGQMALLKEIAPTVTRGAVIRDPAITAGIGMFTAIQSAAPSLGVEASPVNIRDPNEIDRTITAFARAANGGLIVTASALA